MAFFNSAVGVLQTLVVALGAGLGICDQSAGGLRQRQPCDAFLTEKVRHRSKDE